MGLQEIRNALIYAYAFDLLDDEEFVVLYEENYSRELYPYWNFEMFEIENWTDAQCRTELRFARKDLLELQNVLRIPDKFIVSSQRTKCTGLEAMCILLKRLAYPCRYTDMVSTFGRSKHELCLIFNGIQDLVYDEHKHRLQSWNQPFLNQASLHRYAQTVFDKGAPLDNCFGFIDGTVVRISRPQENQRIVYNGHKRVHALKFQSVVIPNGIIANLSGPFEGRRHDSTMLQQSNVLQDLQRVAWMNGKPLCLYGDLAYPINLHLLSPFRNANGQNQLDFNKAMSEVRVSVEWVFGDLLSYFKFVDFKKQLKLGLSPVGKTYLLCGLLQNARSCLYGNTTSDYFGIQPPTLQEYFH